MTEILQKENFDHYEGVMRENLRQHRNFNFGVESLNFGGRFLKASRWHTSQIPLPGWLKWSAKFESFSAKIEISLFSLAGFTVGVKFLFDISPSFVGILARNFEGV
jgi:hypothetical protein